MLAVNKVIFFYLGFIHSLENAGKSWNLMVKIFTSGKSQNRLLPWKVVRK